MEWILGSFYQSYFYTASNRTYDRFTALLQLTFEILPIQIDIDTTESERDKRPTLTTRLLQKYVIEFV